LQATVLVWISYHIQKIVSVIEYRFIRHNLLINLSVPYPLIEKLFYRDRMHVWGNFAGATLGPVPFPILPSADYERAMMIAAGIRQMVSLSPESVNNGRASLRIFGFHVCGATPG
jgi:hypothetical protein